MPIFISYSHANKSFVDKLATQLVRRNVNIWVDRWELSVGDSIIEKVQDAVEGASALLVILSKASTTSQWCQKELSAGLLRELEEKRVVVLPVMLEDCEVPIFARGKMYADFRTDFDLGLRAVVEGIAKVRPFVKKMLEALVILIFDRLKKYMSDVTREREEQARQKADDSASKARATTDPLEAARQAGKEEAWREVAEQYKRDFESLRSELAQLQALVKSKEELALSDLEEKEIPKLSVPAK